MDADPERTFRVGQSVMTGTGAADGVTGSMLTGPWLNGPAGIAPGGALGVLIDGVSAFAALLGRPDGSWSVSAEISLDMCRPLPEAAVLTAHARLDHAGADGGLASGTITGEQGDLVALYRQRTRWVGAPSPAARAAASTARAVGRQAFGPPRKILAAAGDPSAPADLATLLGARIQAADGGAIVDLPVTGELSNPMGNAHGGVIFTAVDLAAQAALLSAGGPVRTESVRVSYPRPLPGGTTARFEARVAHRGLSLGIVQVTALNDRGKPAVIATVTTGRE